jgi:hypothetical protein
MHTTCIECRIYADDILYLMPQKPRFTVILTSEEIEELRNYAKAETRSLSQQAAFILREWLAKKRS